MKQVRIVLAVGTVLLLGCSRDGDSPPTFAPSSTSTAFPPIDGSTTSQATISDKDTSAASATLGAPTADETQAPEDAMTLYRRAQSLMKEEKWEEGYATAKKARAKFFVEGVSLPWLRLESIETGGKRVEVHLNMTKRERQMPDDGIVRPLSFRIFVGGEDPLLVQVLDFEIARSNGKSVTAAIGEMKDGSHANYGMIDVDASYQDIRKRVLELATSE